MRSTKRNSGWSSFVQKTGALLATLGLAVFCLTPPTHAADTNVNVKVCYPTPYPAPTITSPTDGTTTEDSSILLTGEATPNIPVYAYRNDVQVGFVTAGGDGVFEISVSLALGSNALKASTNNDCHAPAFSSTVTVNREDAAPPPDPDPGRGPTEPTPEPPADSPEEPDQTDDQSQTPGSSVPDGGQRPPSEEQSPEEGQRPVIMQPQDGTLVREPFVLVMGEAAPNTSVRILRNDQVMAEVLTDDEGRFMARVSLEPGDNRLVVVTGTGRSELFSETVLVRYEPAITSSRWWVPAVVIGIILALCLVIFLLWQPVLARRIWQSIKRRRSPKK